jgi:diguanylate cyclase (GGDEF)-like protein/PAS domain S-box-containing protein
MPTGRGLNAPFGERRRKGRQAGQLKSRGLVVDLGPQQRARQAARAAEQLSRVVVEGLEEGVVVTDPDRRAVSWNPSALRILELTAEELKGAVAPFKDDLTIVLDHGGRNLEPGESLSRLAQQEGRTVTGTSTRVDRDGRRQYLRVHARPLNRSASQTAGIVLTFADVTATIATQRTLQEERDRAQRYLEVASTLVVVLDALGHVELINRQGCELLGFEEQELLGRDWFDAVVPAADRLDARRAFARLVSGVEPPRDSLETFVRTQCGDDRKIAWRNSALRDEHGEIIAVLRSGEDVTERRRAEAQVAYLAYHDALTGLPNRTQLEEQLRTDLARARRSGEALALLYFDLDNFKLVNDSLGHAAGDEVLRETARRVSELVRGGDVLARQGGDEFLVLLGDLSDNPTAAAESVGSKLLAALLEPFVIAGTEVRTGASIGISLYPDDASDTEALLRHADVAMYRAKAAGGGRLVLHQKPDASGSRRSSLTARLRAAIDAGEMELHYQPVWRLTPSREITGVEALVRWRHPEQGLLRPEAFMSLAEQSTAGDALMAWVVAECCRQARVWQAESLLPIIGVNISPHQLRAPGFASRLVAQVAEAGLVPGTFALELTESAWSVDSTETLEVIEGLRSAGFPMVLDGFGAGYSSLSRLLDLAFDVIKVDGRLLRDVPGDGTAVRLLLAIFDVAAACGAEIVAEGVETEEQLEFLLAHGISRAQGFALGEPVVADELTPLLRRRLLPDAPPRRGTRTDAGRAP